MVISFATLACRLSSVTFARRPRPTTSCQRPRLAGRVQLKLEILEARDVPTVFSPDTRLATSPSPPQNAVVELHCWFRNGQQTFGSGTMIDYNEVLTAGHMVYNRTWGGWASQIKVIGRAGANYYESTMAWARADTRWINNQDLSADWGLVTLNKYQPLGGIVTDLGYLEAPSDTYLQSAPLLATTGYPGDLAGSAVRNAPDRLPQYSTSDRVYGYNADVIASYIDTYQGQSGGPLWHPNAAGSLLIDGVCSHQVPDGSGPNTFTRMTPARIAAIRAAIQDDKAAFATWPEGHSVLTITPPSHATRALIDTVPPTPPEGPLAYMPAGPAFDTPAGTPPADLTEGNAAGWVAWADQGTAALRDDAALKVAGQTSLAFQTTGPFDTSIRYNVGDKLWNLTGYSTLHVAFYAQNANPYGFQNGSPWIRLIDSEGHYFQYQYYVSGNPVDILDQAIGGWRSYDIPLSGSPDPANGWRLTNSGAFDLSLISAVEIHADTWGYDGFNLWVDDLGFRSAPPTITPPSDQVALGGGPAGPAPFAVGDAETPAAGLIVTAASDNPDLVPDANIQLTGAGAGRTVTATPVAGRLGAATVTLTVRDSVGMTSSASFRVAVPGIAGRVFLDRNGDGAMQADEPGQGGLPVYLDANGNGRLDLGEAAAITDGQGAYSFIGLGPGSYIVRGPARGPGWVGTTTAYYAVTLGAGQVVPGANFGNFKRGGLSGRVFMDRDGNGLRDPGDLPQARITIYLDGNRNGRLDPFERRVVTGPTGIYVFTNLGPGAYSIREVLPAGWLHALPPGGSDTVALTSGGVGGHDLGNFLRGSLSGRTITITGAALRRVVYLDGNLNGLRDLGERWVLTDAYGLYSFANLGPGFYIVREAVPLGWHLVSPPGGAFGVTMTSGKRAVGLNFRNALGSPQALRGAVRARATLPPGEMADLAAWDLP